jgi:hypothetical protein
MISFIGVFAACIVFFCILKRSLFILPERTKPSFFAEICRLFKQKNAALFRRVQGQAANKDKSHERQGSAAGYCLFLCAGPASFQDLKSWTNFILRLQKNRLDYALF